MVFLSTYSILLILYCVIIGGGYCQISQLNNDRRDLTKKLNFQKFNQRNIQFVQSPDTIPQLLNGRKPPIKITSDQASNIPGLSMLKGQNLPPGTIIQKRGQSIRIVLPKMNTFETTIRPQVQQRQLTGGSSRINKNSPLLSQQLPGGFPNRGRQTLQQNFKFQKVNFQQNQIPHPRQPNNNFQPFPNQQLKNIASSRRQLVPVGPPRKEIPPPVKIPMTVPISDPDNNLIQTNRIQPPAPFVKEKEVRRIVNPPSELPPSDFVVDELNRSSNFLETARRLALARRLRIA